MHNLKPRVARSAALAAAVISTITLLPGAAHADSATFHDKARDVRGGSDLRTVAVNNGAENLRVELTFRNLKRLDMSGAGASVYIDTDGAPGPEYVLGAGLSNGTDYQLSRIDSWDMRDAQGPVACPVSVRLNYQADTAKMRIDKECFAEIPGDGGVRVEVRSGGDVNDWLGRRHAFAAVVAQS